MLSQRSYREPSGADLEIAKLVVKEIPDNSVAVGNPCHVIRAITDEDKKTCWSR